MRWKNFFDEVGWFSSFDLSIYSRSYQTFLNTKSGFGLGFGLTLGRESWGHLTNKSPPKTSVSTSNQVVTKEFDEGVGRRVKDMVLYTESGMEETRDHVDLKFRNKPLVSVKHKTNT